MQIDDCITCIIVKLHIKSHFYLVPCFDTRTAIGHNSEYLSRSAQAAHASGSQAARFVSQTLLLSDEPCHDEITSPWKQCTGTGTLCENINSLLE